MAKAPQQHHPQPPAGLSEAETRLARYRQIERRPDGMGRVIGVRRLRLSEQNHIKGMTPEMTGSDEIVLPSGEKFSIPHRAEFVIAASVCEIDSIPIPFPRNRGELDAIMDRLDREGMQAASEAVGKFYEGEGETDGIERAKNLAGMPSSA